MIKRADGSYSQRGLWDNIRANKGSGKKPTPEMLEQERKIKAKYPEGGVLGNIQLGLDAAQFIPYIGEAAYLASLPFTTYDVVKNLYKGNYKQAGVDALGYIPTLKAFKYAAKGDKILDTTSKLAKQYKKVNTTVNTANLSNDAQQVLANKENYSPAMVKKANFAKNAAKWHHADGGEIDPKNTFGLTGNYSRTPNPEAIESNYKLAADYQRRLGNFNAGLNANLGFDHNLPLNTEQFNGSPTIIPNANLGLNVDYDRNNNNFSGSFNYNPINQGINAEVTYKKRFAEGGRVLPKYAEAGWLTKNKAGVGAGLGFAGDTTNLLFDNNVFGTRNEVTDSEGNVLGEAQSDAGSQTQGALSGALKGASAGAALGPWGMAGGALIGGVAGFLTADTGAEDKLNQIKRERNAQISFKNMLGKGPIENNSIQTNSLALSAYGGYINKKYANGGMKTLNQNHPEATEEVELGESAMLPNGMNLEFGGEKHENGGLETNLPEGTRIFSDRLKLGKKTYAQLAKPIQNKIEKLKDNNSQAAKNTVMLLTKQTDELFENQEQQKQLDEMKNNKRTLFAKGGMVKYDGGGEKTPLDIYRNIINSETGKNFTNDEILEMFQPQIVNNDAKYYFKNSNDIDNDFQNYKLKSNAQYMNPETMKLMYRNYITDPNNDKMSYEDFVKKERQESIDANNFQMKKLNENYLNPVKEYIKDFPNVGNSKINSNIDAVLNYKQQNEQELQNVNDELGTLLDKENIITFNQNINPIASRSLRALNFNNKFNKPNIINSPNFKVQSKINPILQPTDYQPGSYGFAKDPVLNLNINNKPQYIPSNSDQADYEYLKANPDIMKRGIIQPRTLSTLSPLDVKGSKMISPINNGKTFNLNEVKSDITPPKTPSSDFSINKGDIGTAGALGTSLLGNLIQRSNLNKVAPPRTLVAPTFTAGRTPVKADYSADLQSADNQFNADRRGVMMNSGNYSTQAGNLGQLRAEQLRNRSKILQNQNNANAVLMNEYQKAQADAINKNALSNYTTDQENMENLYNYNLWKTGQTNAADASAFNTSGQMFNNMVTGQNQLDAAEMYRRMYAQKVRDDLGFLPKEAKGGTVRKYFANGGSVYRKALENLPNVNRAEAMDAEYASYLDAKGQPLQDTFKSKITGLDYKVLPRKEKDLYAANLWKEAHGSAPTKKQVAATTKAIEGKKTSSPGAKTVAQMMSDKFSVSDQEANLVNSVNAEREDNMSYLPKSQSKDEVKTIKYLNSVNPKAAQYYQQTGDLQGALDNYVSPDRFDVSSGSAGYSIGKAVKEGNMQGVDYLNAGMLLASGLSSLGGKGKIRNIVPEEIDYNAKNKSLKTSHNAMPEEARTIFRNERNLKAWKEKTAQIEGLSEYYEKKAKNFTAPSTRVRDVEGSYTRSLNPAKQQGKLAAAKEQKLLPGATKTSVDLEDEGFALAFDRKQQMKKLNAKLNIAEGADNYTKAALKRLEKKLDDLEISNFSMQKTKLKNQMKKAVENKDMATYNKTYRKFTDLLAKGEKEFLNSND